MLVERWLPLIAAAPINVTALLHATTRSAGPIYAIGPDASFAKGLNGRESTSTTALPLQRN